MRDSLRCLPLWVALISSACTSSAHAVDRTDTRMLFYPAVSKSHIAFVYDADIWLAGPQGQTPRRLTTAASEESQPHFSPDGKWLAFSANYDGNQDVFVMPSGGGAPRRLTWHPAKDVVMGFSPDGAVLFASQRTAHTRRHLELYTVPANGGTVKRLPIPHGFRASFSPDGKRIAYNPHPERWRQWKGYRGGTASRIWVMDLSSYEVLEIPKPKGGCNDTAPMWIKDHIYFASDRDGEFNLYSFHVPSKRVERLTRFRDHPVMDPSASESSIIFERAGYLYRFEIATRKAERLKVGIGADLREARPRFVSGPKWLRAMEPSPKGKRLAVEYRGEILTVPLEKGAIRNLSQSPGAHERDPIWSPDGTKLAWFSDAAKAYQLVVHERKTGKARSYKLKGAGFYRQPRWSPDGTRIAFSDNALRLYVIELKSGAQKRIAQESQYGPIVTMDYRFSPDSAWLAYTLNVNGLLQTVFLYDVKKDRSHRVTEGLGEMSSPVFDPSGRYLFMLGSTDAGPIKDWFMQSGADMQMHHEVFALALSSKSPPLLPPQNDEVAPPKKDEKAKKDKKDEKKTKAPPKVEVEFKGLIGRLERLPGRPSAKRGLLAGADGTVYWIETVGLTSFATYQGPGALKRFNPKTRKTIKIADQVTDFRLTADHKTVFFKQKKGWKYAPSNKVAKAAKSPPLAKIKVRTEPRAEWPQIFDEAWRINRDYFYATNYHGLNWSYIRKKYAPLVHHAATRKDVSRLIQRMASELGVGHSYLRSGDTIAKPTKVGVGLLGADFEVDKGRYRIAKIYGGFEWQPKLKAPLVGPGLNVSPGDYLLTVEGKKLTADENLFARFEGKVGVPVRIGVASSPSGKVRELTVKPISNELSLRHHAWIMENIKKVDRATGGQVAYVYLPNTAGDGHRSFKRYFFPQSHKKAVILDERYNGGGLVADYYINFLRQPFVANWALRYGEDLRTPRAAIFGPKVMIADETAGSGGDLLPWMFKKYKLGPVVGKRTWGGLVGILGFPVLMDGGQVTAPNIAIYNEDGWIVENKGVAPDVEVEQWPKQVNAGRDPQLERAIRIALEGLRKQKKPTLKRPAFPKRR